MVFNSPQVYSGCGWWDEMVLAVEAAGCLTLPPSQGASKSAIRTANFSLSNLLVMQEVCDKELELGLIKEGGGQGGFRNRWPDEFPRSPHKVLLEQLSRLLLLDCIPSLTNSHLLLS